MQETLSALSSASRVLPRETGYASLWTAFPNFIFHSSVILKIGAIVQPLFSAFGDESLFVRLDNAGTRVVITQKKHLGKVRKIRSSLPALEFVIIVDNVRTADLEPGEILFSLEDTEPVERFEISPTRAETHSLLHYTSGTTGQPKGVKHVHYSIMSQYLTTKWVLDLRDDDIYWCTADPGWVTGTSIRNNRARGASG
ncbi:MAG: AMP-binding protein [Bacteroidales bacterium]|nr:AMP-binding protein [Bacteroidales bacterium]